MIVAIDGPAASGKTTTARGVAQRMGFRHIDTGALYRAVTLFLLRHKTNIADASEVEHALSGMDLRVEFNDEGQQTYLGNENLADKIRSVEVTQHVSEVSALACVRGHLLPLQRRIAEEYDVVLEGRDIGTVVFPHAEIKIFMVADTRIRAQRRQLDFKKLGIDKDLAELEAEINARDKHNATRNLAPMIAADDAIELDTSDLSIDEQIEFIISRIRMIRNNGGNE